MKKDIFLLTLLSAMPNLYAVQTSIPTANWETLPIELRSHILSYLPQIKSYNDWIRAMTVSKEFHSLLNDQQFLNDFAKRLDSQKHFKAVDLLASAAEHKNLALTKALIDANPQLKQEAIGLLLMVPFKSVIKNAPFPTNENILNTLLQAGININSTQNAGYNGLMEALFHKDKAKAEWFLQHGIDLNHQDKFGKTINDWIDEFLVANQDLKREWHDLINLAKVEREKAENQQ